MKNKTLTLQDAPEEYIPLLNSVDFFEDVRAFRKLLLLFLIACYTIMGISLYWSLSSLSTEPERFYLQGYNGVTFEVLDCLPEQSCSTNNIQFRHIK